MRNLAKLLLPLLLLGGCIPFRAVFLGRPDGRDIHRFPSAIVEAGNECFQFASDTTHIGKQIKVNEWGSGTPVFVPLEELMNAHAVRSLVVIRNDTVLFEGYGQRKNAADVHPSYSIAKSFTSALVGIAISEGIIGSVHDAVIDHIPELKDIPLAEHLRIEHLLKMTSGIRHTLRDDATIYYGNDVKRVLSRIKFAHRPGTYQEYVNVNVQLLGIILHRATGMTPAEYLEQKIWHPIGMCANGQWTTDRKGEVLTFCCMGATALDYAKFGRLYIDNGLWNGQRIIPESWCKQSVVRDTTEGSSFNYGYGWHIGEAAYGDYMADGMYKQYLYVHPDKRIIIVLLCNRENVLKAERVQWRNVFKQIVDQL